MPLSKQQADAASDALLQEPRNAQERLSAQAATRVKYFAPGHWTAPAALLGAVLAGGIGYFGSGNFFPACILGVGLGVGLAQGFWRKRHKV